MTYLVVPDHKGNSDRPKVILIDQIIINIFYKL